MTRFKASEIGKAELHDLPRSGRLAETVRCANAIVRENRRIEPDSWCLVFSTGRVSHAVRDLRYFNVREMGSSEPHGRTQSRQKSRLFPSC